MAKDTPKKNNFIVYIRWFWILFISGVLLVALLFYVLHLGSLGNSDFRRLENQIQI